MNDLGLAGPAPTPTEFLFEQTKGFFDVLSDSIVLLDLRRGQPQVIGDPEAAVRL